MPWERERIIARSNVSNLDTNTQNTPGCEKRTVPSDRQLLATTNGWDQRKVMGLSHKQRSYVAQGSGYQVIWNQCHQQIGDKFGCIPLDKFVTYQGPDVQWDTIPDIFQAHKLIK